MIASVRGFFDLSDLPDHRATPQEYSPMPAKKTAPAKSTRSKRKASPAKKAASPKKRATSAKAKSSSAGGKEVAINRRGQADRRSEEKAKSEPKIERREKVQRRRQIDPTTCERDYSAQEVEFMNSMEEYKRKSGRMFPTCSEVLEVICDLGYVKLSTAELVALRPESAESAETKPAETKPVETESAETEFDSAEELEVAAVNGWTV